MIKIISSQGFPNEVVVAGVNLCNQFNQSGYKCVFYGLDNWHLNKCESEPLTRFNIRSKDIIIVMDYDITSYDDFFNLNNKIRNLTQLKKLKFFKKTKALIKKKVKKTRNYFKGLYYRWFKGVKFIFSAQGANKIDLSKIAKFYDKVHLVSEEYVDQKISNNFISPNFGDDLVKQSSSIKNNKIAAIIGDIYADNQIELSIEHAIKGGMDKVVIYGFMRDPVYFYKNIEPLFKKYTGKIELAGFVPNYQEIFDLVSDVYFYPIRKIANNFEYYCQITNSKFHSNENVKAINRMEEKNILAIWKKELGEF